MGRAEPKKVSPWVKQLWPGPWAACLIKIWRIHSLRFYGPPIKNRISPAQPMVFYFEKSGPWAGLGWAGLGWAGLGWAVMGLAQPIRCSDPYSIEQGIK
ncbi:unnamed protein product [Adineta steineri]|uniref:Uncharacterized protein n=1 Tax=Adineta steineri TaxID=433720 RepID=A0A815J8D3_9BILA|nr:unnamed protein product [Adineta steineri]CAF3918315.1 unnamed protein product [Adineta steineri]